MHAKAGGEEICDNIQQKAKGKLDFLGTWKGEKKGIMEYLWSYVHIGPDSAKKRVR